MNRSRNITRVVAVEWAARRVLFVAKWLIDAEWPIPLQDIRRVVRELEEAIRACALPEFGVECADGTTRLLVAFERARSVQEDRNRDELVRRVVLLATYAATIRSNAIPNSDLKKLGVLAAAVAESVAKEIVARERAARDAS